MPFEKGKSGNPGGRPRELVWRDAIHLAVKRIADGGEVRQLDLLADRLVAAALDGDLYALREIGDRLDGKAMQAIAVEGDAPVIPHKIIIRFDEPKGNLSETQSG